MKKTIYSAVIVFITTLLLLSLSSCGRSHACMGNWRGRTYYGEFINLYVSKNGRFTMDYFPRAPDTAPEISRAPRYTYTGEWKQVSDCVVEMRYDSDVYYNGETKEENSSSGTFYLQSDGAFTQNNMNFSNPICKLNKRGN